MANVRPYQYIHWLRYAATSSSSSLCTSATFLVVNSSWSENNKVKSLDEVDGSDNEISKNKISLHQIQLVARNQFKASNYNNTCHEIQTAFLI